MAVKTIPMVEEHEEMSLVTQSARISSTRMVLIKGAEESQVMNISRSTRIGGGQTIFKKSRWNCELETLLSLRGFNISFVTVRAWPPRITTFFKWGRRHVKEMRSGKWTRVV